MMRRVGVVCVEFSGSTESTGTSGGADSLAEECGKGRRVVSGLCTDFHHHAGRLGGTKSGPRRDSASRCGGQNELPMLGSRALRGSQPVISSSQASSGASVCVVRSRAAVWQTSKKVLEAQSLLGLGKRTQMLCGTSNKRSALSDPNDTFRTNANSGRFSFLK